MLKTYLFDDIDETVRRSERGEEPPLEAYDKEVINTARHMINDGLLQIPQSEKLQKVFSATSKTADEIGIKFEQYIAEHELDMTVEKLRQFGAEFLKKNRQPRDVTIENILYAYFRRKVSTYMTDTRYLLKTTLGDLSLLVDDFRTTHPLLSQIYPDQIPGVGNEIIAILQIFSGGYLELIKTEALTKEMDLETCVDEVIDRNQKEFEFKRDEKLFAKYLDIAKEVLREKILEKVSEEKEVVSFENIVVEDEICVPKIGIVVEEKNPEPEFLTEEDKTLLLKKIEKLVAENIKLAKKLSSTKSKKKAVGMILAGFGGQESVSPSEVMDTISADFWGRFGINFD